MKELTIDNFIRRLRRRKNYGWFIRNHDIRCLINGTLCCPITGVHESHMMDIDFLEAARILPYQPFPRTK